MKLQDVILKAMAKKISWLDAAEIIGVCDRTMRRMREGYQKFGYDGLRDGRSGKQCSHRVPMETAEEVLRLYRDVYFDLNVRHFHEKLRDKHQIQLSYTLGAVGIAGSGTGGQAAQARATSAKTSAAAAAGYVAAHRWQ